MVATLAGATGATRNRPTKEQSCRRQPVRRLTWGTITPRIQKRVDVTIMGADSGYCRNADLNREESGYVEDHGCARTRVT